MYMYMYDCFLLCTVLQTNSDLENEVQTLHEDVQCLEQDLEDEHFRLEELQERVRLLSESVIREKGVGEIGRGEGKDERERERL